MDEATRRLERAAAGGMAEPTLELARHHLRSGRPQAALQALTDAASADAGALSAEALLALGRVEEASQAAAAALRERPGSVAVGLRAALVERLGAQGEAQDAASRLGWLRRCAELDLPRVSAEEAPDEPLLARVQHAYAPSLRAALIDDPAPLVRAVAGGWASAPRHPDEAVPTRLFSAHGADFQSGPFVALETSCEERLAYVDAELLHAVEALLRPYTLAERWEVAFGRGYGLAVDSQTPAGDVEDAVGQVNQARLPFSVALHLHQPFDVLSAEEGDPEGLAGEDARLARRFAEDLARHPARLGDPMNTAPYARVLGAFRGGSPSAAKLVELMDACRARYGAVGVRALERFAARAREENERLAQLRARRQLDAKGDGAS